LLPRALVDLNQEIDEPLEKLDKSVTPAKAGVQKSLKELDSGFRRNDKKDFCKRLRCDRI
jgi:hypothetical protein